MQGVDFFDWFLAGRSSLMDHVDWSFTRVFETDQVAFFWNTPLLDGFKAFVPMLI